MAVSRVDYAGRTLVDLTADTVAASALLYGFTAHGADGQAVAGALPRLYVIDGLLLLHASWGEAEADGTLRAAGEIDGETITIGE